ncbi:MAG: reverse transcriptase/maturase family protein [Nanoarchaeota archaeon]|nr:reverse transcriptase/maturase family protein [Nanoarchaeota archaeon]
MQEDNKLWIELCSYNNLELAFLKARKRKTKKLYVKKFEKNLIQNLLDLKEELLLQTYSPSPLTTFILRDPKTRKISKSEFRDRIIHHALVNLLEPIFEKSFIYDSYANRKGKGTSKALQRFEYFKRQVSMNNTAPCFILKEDIKHYFEEVDHEVLLKIIQKKIKDKNVICLIKRILVNGAGRSGGGRTTKGMPLGNLTSQFFANVYLNEFDNFIKRRLQIKHYIRYVDDFVILDSSKQKLEETLGEIKSFLMKKLKLELHPDKTRILAIPRGLDFIGFRNFPNHKLLRKRNIRKINQKISNYANGKLVFSQIMNYFIGWKGFAELGNTFKRRRNILKVIYKTKFQNQNPHFS